MQAKLVRVDTGQSLAGNGQWQTADGWALSATDGGIDVVMGVCIRVTKNRLDREAV